MTLIPPLRSFVTLLAVLAPATAQVVQTGASCPVGAPHLQVSAALSVSGAPAAGSSLQFSSNLQMTSNAPYLSSTVYVLAIGLSDPAAPLSSCGCELRTSFDLIDAQSLLLNVQGPSMGLPHFGSTQAAPFTLNIPPGVSGAVIHAQGFYLDFAFTSCQGFGVAATPTESYRITVL